MNFSHNQTFKAVDFQHMKPLQIDQPSEDKVVEAAKKLCELQEGTYTPQHKVTYQHGFIDGVKWQSEQPIETDFKSKVIEKVEQVINDYEKATEVAVEEKDYGDADKYSLIKGTFENFLKVAKEL